MALIQPKKTLLKKQNKLNNSLIKPANFKPVVLACMLAFAYGYASSSSAEEPLITTIPKTNYAIPPGDLSEMLPLYASQAGVLLGFEPGLTVGKTTKGLKGEYGLYEGFSTLLKGSGLEVVQDKKGGYTLIKAVNKSETNLNLEEVQVRAKRFYEIGPLPGLALTKEEIPGNVQSITAKEIKESHSLSLTDLMNTHLQSVNVNDYQSNPFQMDVQYRGFTASPQLGTAQGLSVFLDGIRVNEPFGDVVNWDMIPLNAINGLDVFPGSNPIFGLGTLGGALAMRTKSGFDGKSVDVEVLGGSFNRKQLQISAGDNNGVIAGFVSGNFFLEDGWRDDSPSRVNQVFGKAEWRNDNLQLSFSGLYAGNKLTGNGLLPTQMVDQNPKQVYTSPDETKNDLMQFQLSGIWDVSDTFNITGQIYNRKSKRKSSTSDVNENFGGNEARPATATSRGEGQQVLYGMQDINRDGLPDYNNYAFNVAADEFYRALDVNGVAEGDPGFDIDNLAYGTNFNSQANANQAQVAAADGSGNTVWNWVSDPRRFNDFSGPNGELIASNLPNTFNAPTTAEYEKLVRFQFENQEASTITLDGYARAKGYQPNSNDAHPSTGSISQYFTYAAFRGYQFGSYVDENGFAHDYWQLNPLNERTIPNQCGLSSTGVSQVAVCDYEANGQYKYRDGKYGYIDDGSGLGYSKTGHIEGTPTAIFNDTEIDQIGKGGAVQLNWNFDKHKFMIGASYDTSDSTYDSKQYLGLLDANRHGYVAPELLGYEYSATSPESGFALNDFKGDNTTKSIYASETWTPIKTLNITAAARFNHTKVTNKLDVSNVGAFGDVNRIFNLLNNSTLCTDNNNDGTVEASECPTGIGNTIPFDPLYGYIGDGIFDGESLIGMHAGEVEKFTYRSLNPSLGLTWQANEDLNLYANWSRGARTPTTIELGCAYDTTPILVGTDPITGDPIYRARGLEERRSCNLPGAMSGDPYLEQVRSTSYEVGARGWITPNIQWNASIYRTDLKDDIYMASVTAARSYFQNIGETRRQGFEMGLKGNAGKAHFGLNYSLTDATFQSPFKLASPSNSSAGNVYDIDYFDNGTYQQIQVKPGNRIPGVPLHNLNANFSYELTPQWRVGMNAVMHSSAFVRGNENNKHKAGPASPITGPFCGGFICQFNRADFGSGKTSGYTVFNFQTSYKFTPEWTLGLQVNNVFDKQYASAGRLGFNAFSPSINGAIGVGGFNYNSNDWQGTSFLGIGAPRSAFVTLGYQFQPDDRANLIAPDLP